MQSIVQHSGKGKTAEQIKNISKKYQRLFILHHNSSISLDTVCQPSTIPLLQFSSVQSLSHV